MPQSPSQIVHSACGSPPMEDCGPVDGAPPCWCCAGPTVRGCDRFAWATDTMTDQNQCRAPDSHVVCEACCFVRQRTSPVPGREPKEGKKAGGNFRNYSHLWSSERGYQNASKGEKPVILAFLRARHTSPWFAAVADSGQRHVLPYAPRNGPRSRGVVRFDDALVQLPDVAGWRIVDDLAALLTAGATKEEVSTGAYTSRAYTLARAELEAFERAYGHLRGGSWFALALWLSQRDEEAVAARLAAEKEEKKGKNGKAKRTTTREAPQPDGGVLARGEGSVPRDTAGKRAQTLGATPEPSAVRGKAKRDSGRVDDGSPARPASDQPRQLGLF